MFQFDESTDVVDAAQSCVFIRMALEDGHVGKRTNHNFAFERTHKRRKYFQHFHGLCYKNKLPLEIELFIDPTISYLIQMSAVFFRHTSIHSYCVLHKRKHNRRGNEDHYLI